MRILIAEDDPNILDGVATLLEREGFSVLRARDGREAVDIWSRERPDLCILDIMMPRMSGYDVCRTIRAKDTLIPILFLSAKAEEIDRVVGLELGADDYISKPFGTRELLARVGALLRRARASASMGGDGRAPSRDDGLPFRMGDLDIYPGELRARRGEFAADLGPRDVAILQLLYRLRGEVVDREELFRTCWGAEFPGSTRAVDQHISQLRRKVELDPANPVLIRTVHGAGYRFE